MTAGHPHSAHRMTDWLLAWRQGDENALELLTEAVYSELRQLANRRLQQEAASHTLQPTDLVHETYIQLCAGSDRLGDRGRFFRMAARVMRNAPRRLTSRKLCHICGVSSSMPG